MHTIIDDLTPDFFAFWERAHGCAPAEQARLWRDLYESPHQELFAAGGDRHGRAEDLAAALARFPAVVPRLRAAVPEIRAGIERIGPQLARLFGLKAATLRWALVVGLFSSDGWLAIIDGEPVCFVAVEMLGAPRLAEILLAHEAAHGCHVRCLTGGFDGMGTVAHGLFSEGLAVLASVQIVPGFPEGRYLWPGRDETTAGADTEAWVAACEARWPALRGALRRDLSAEDEQTTAAYFLGRGELNELPERAGYFAGFRLVNALANRPTIAELARWSAERGAEEIARALDEAERCPTGPIT